MTANTIALLFNGLTLAIALGLLILILWQDPNSEANRFFSLFLVMVVVWAGGSLLARSAAFVHADEGIIQSGLRLLEIGFSGANISVYIYSVVVTGVQGRFFRTASLIGLGVVFVYQVLFFLVADSPRAYEVGEDGLLIYSFDRTSLILYLCFQVATMVLVWRQRMRFRERALAFGIFTFSLGQMLGLLSPRFRMLGVSEDVSALGAFLMSSAIVRQQIMVPLLGRAKQLEVVRDVGLAITSRLRLRDTLAAIAAQAAEFLGADGAAIFLKVDGMLRLAAVFDLPEQFVGLEIGIGHGVAGMVAAEQRGYRVDNYKRDWKGEIDLPFANETFGAVACVPLIFAGEVVGVLLVIHGLQGGLFDHEDMHLLELLGPQAAVAITNSRLFEAERELTTDLVAAKNQLETVLTSTENPVIAVDRNFRIIFANRAAARLLDTEIDPVGWLLVDFVPKEYLPSDPRRVLRDLQKKRVHVYVIDVRQRTFFCHVAELNKPGPEGWVAVLNDVTQLKELDQLKSQMVRMTSHDLKNPLQAAMSYMELLVEDGEGIFSEEMHEFSENIWTQLNRMYRIISGILDLERVQSGPPAFEICVLDRILQRVFDEMQGQARSKGIDMELTIDANLPAVLGDVHQLGQALTNVIDNAVKFTASGGRVSIKAEATFDYVTVHIADTGIGIPPKDQSRIFERFYRGKHQDMIHVTGSGLGLSLVKAIIDSHNGRVEVESTPGQGSTFHLHLPVGEF